MILDSPFASGSLQVQNSITSSDGLLTGDLTVLGTINATIEGTTATASYVQLSNIDGSASLASDISNNTDNIGTLTDATSSYALKTQISGSFTDVSSSIAQDIANISTDFADITNKPTLLSGSQQIADDISGSFLLNTTDTLTGDLTVTGTVTAQEFHTEFVSSSIIFESGSTQFGNSSDDTHIFSGSIKVHSTAFNQPVGLNVTSDGKVGIGAATPTYNLDVNPNVGTSPAIRLRGYSSTLRLQTYNSNQYGRILFASDVAEEGEIKYNYQTDSIHFKANQTDNLLIISSSGLITGSRFAGIFEGALSSSAQIASDISGSSTDLSSSIASDIEDILDGTDTVTSASYALTASYADSGAGFPFSGSAIITGSLLVSQSNVDFTSATGVSGSFSGSFVGDGSQLSGVTSYTDSDTLSYINSIGVVSGSAQVNSGSFSGSFEGDGSGLTGVVSEISEVATVTSTFTSATSITVTHNFGTKNVIVAVYDDSDNQVIPESVNVSNENSVVVTFPTAKSGTVVVAKGGHIVSGSAQDSDKLGGQPAAAYATTGSNTFIGNQTHSGSILPAVTNTYDLGSANFQWRDLFLSSGSLYIDGTQVISSDANTLTFTTDAGQSIKILETGGDDITFQTDTGNIELKGTVEVLSGKKIIDSAGTVIQFGDSLGITGSIDVSGTVDGIDLQTMSSSLATRIKNQEDFSGSLDATFATDAEIDNAVSSLNSATGSYALKTQISGSFTSLSSSIEQRFSDSEGSISSLNTATSSYLQNTTDTFTGTLTVSGSNTIKSTNPTLLLVQQGDVNQANSGRIVFAESTGNTAGHMIIRYDGSDDKIHFDSAIDGTSDLFTFGRSGDATVSGDLTVAGTVTAQEFHTEFVSSSIVFESGSTKFGDSSDDVHDFTGSLNVDGDVTLTNSSYLSFQNSSGVKRDILTLNSSNKVLIDNPTGGYTSINGLLYVDVSDNVGIGTDSPSNTLHIYRNATQGALGSVNTANATVRIQDSGASMYIDGNTIATTSQGWISTLGAYDFDIATNEISRIKVKSSGYVGIGYDAPNHPLHVLGKTRFDAYSVSDPDSGSSPYTGSHTFTYYDGIGLSVIGGQGSHTGDTLVLGQETGTSANFSFIKAISDTNGSPAVEFVVNGLGSVGIGVSSPGEALHVGGSAILDSTNANLKIKSGTTGTSGSIYWTFNTDSTVYASAGIEYDNRTTDGFLIDSGYPITLDFASSHIRFSNNGSEKARINTSGQLGIGTNAPDVLLHTVGTRAGVSSTGGSGPIAKFESEDSYIDIISTADGTWGSSVNLIEGSASLATNKDMWSMIRNTNSGGSSLHFTYGTGLNPSANTAQFILSNSGEATFSSVVNATAVNTGQGDYELYAMDQNVRTTDTPKFASLQLSAGNTPTIYFNGTNDGGDGANSDFAIKATPEGLDFYEPEDGNKIHFQILDDTGVNAVYGYQLNGTEVIDSSRNLTNIGTGNFSGAVSISGDLTLAKGTTAKQAYHDLYIGGADLAGADSSIYIGNAGDGTGYGWMMYYSGSGSGNDNKLVFVSENLGTENQVMTMVQGGSVGIGVVSPSYDLHVDGTFRASGTGSIGGPMGINDTSPEATLDVNGEVVIGTGTQAINADADLTLRNGVAFVGIDLKSARTSGNIGGLRYYGTASDATPVAQFLVETDGSYHFYNGTNGAQDRVTINSDGKIGVGTTTVSSMLHLHGDTNTWATSPTIVMSSSSTANANIRNWRIGPADTNYGNFHIGVSSAQGALVDSTGEAQTFTIDYNSNVGIGTAAPNVKLHVHGASAHLNFTGGNNRILFTSNRALEGATDGSVLQLGESYSKTVLYNNVGIGNTNPGNPLSIKKVTNTSATATGTTFIEVHNDVGGDLNQQKSFIDFIFEDDNDNDWPQVRIGAEVGQNGNADSTIKEGSGAFVVYTNNASTNSPGSPSALNEKFRVDYAGNVGIGTVSPSGSLAFANEVGRKLVIYNGSGDNDYYGINLQSSEFRIHSGGQGAATGGITFGKDDGSTFTEAMRIQNNGNVGIGTTAPDGDLHIYNTATSAAVRIGGGNGSGNSRIFIQSNGDDSYIDNYGDNAYKHLYIQANRLLLNTAANTGNVGIGTTNPVSPLHINKSGTSNVQEILLTLMSDTSNRPVLQFSEGGAGITGGQSIEYNGMGSGDTNYIAINSVSGASMFEFYSGGNSTFKGAQHYYGTEDANNGTTTLVLRNYDSTLVNAGDIQGRIQFTGRYWSDSASQLVESRIEHGHQLGNGNGGSFLRFMTQTGGSAPAEQMRIDRDGSVGIGTTTPSAKLHIVGDTPLKIHSATNGVGAKINFSDHAGGSYAQNGTMEYVHSDTQSFGSGNAFKFYGSESSMSFHVAGKGLFTGDVTAFYSDMRLKTKLGDIENPIEKIQALSGFYYEPNEVAQSYGYEKERRLGLSAQDVQKVLPEAVSPAAIDPEYMSVDYAKLVPLLVEGIKELKSEVDSLKQTIKDLQK